jgi:hypothetical protein
VSLSSRRSICISVHHQGVLYLPAAPDLRVVEVYIVILMVGSLEAIVAEHAGLVFLAVSADPNDVISVRKSCFKW